MLLKRLHVPVGICYSGGKEGMRHSNRGKPKMQILHLKRIPSQASRLSVAHQHLRQRTTQGCRTVCVAVQGRLGVKPSVSISGAGCSLSRPRDSPEYDFLLAMFGSARSRRRCALLLWCLKEFLRSSYPKKTLKLTPERITNYGFKSSQSAQSEVALLPFLTLFSVPDRYKL